MAMTGQSNQRKASKKQSNRRNDDKRIIKIEGAEDKEQTVTVHHAAAREKGKSTWSWHEEFVLEWSETLITERKKSPR